MQTVVLMYVSFLHLSYPFSWCLMLLSHPEGMFLVSSSCTHGIWPSCPRSGGCWLIWAAPWPDTCSVPYVPWKFKWLRQRARNSLPAEAVLLVKISPVSSFTISYLKFPSSCSILFYPAMKPWCSVWLVPLPVFPRPSRAGRTNVMLLSWPGTHILVHYQDPCYFLAFRIMKADGFHQG